MFLTMNFIYIKYYKGITFAVTLKQSQLEFRTQGAIFR